MTVHILGDVAVVLEHITAIQQDTNFSGQGESLLIHLVGQAEPIRVTVDDAEGKFLSLCEALKNLGCNQPRIA